MNLNWIRIFSIRIDSLVPTSEFRLSSLKIIITKYFDFGAAIRIQLVVFFKDRQVVCLFFFKSLEVFTVVDKKAAKRLYVFKVLLT